MQTIQWYFKTFDQLSGEELYLALQLRNEVFVLGQNCVYQDADGFDFQAIHLLGKMDQKIVAYTRLFAPDIIEKGKCNFGRVATAPTERGKGYGKEMMTVAKKYLKTNWPEGATLIHAQLYLKKFYENLGFRQCSETYDEVGIPHIRMVWEHNQ